MTGQSMHAVAGNTLVQIGVQWTKSVEASSTLVGPQAPSGNVNCTQPSGNNCGMPSRGNAAGDAASALTVSNVLFPRMTWAVMKSVNPLTHRAPKMRELFIAIEIPPGQWDSRSSEPRCLFSENVHCAPTSLGGPNDYIRQPAHAFVSYTILSLSSGAHQHAHEAECQRHPKQNPKRKPHSRTDCVRVEKLAAPVAAESPLATQHEYERQHNPANHLRCDRVI